MGAVWIYVNMIRAIPAILTMLFVADKDCIRQDIYRSIGKTNPYRDKNMIFCFVWLLTNMKTFRNVFYYRIKKQNKLLARVLNIFFPQQGDCEISGEIGPGLVIWHGYGTIISCKKIGENFSVWQGVTIGRNPKPGIVDDRPTIGDNCCVYSNAVVAGGIELGDNIKIGAGCVCMKDIPSNSVVLGNPCMIKFQ